MFTFLSILWIIENLVLCHGSNIYYKWNRDSKVLEKISIDIPTTAIHDMKIKQKYHSRAGQDMVVAGLLPQSNHFFIDLAANHYGLFSNTLPLEMKHNWTGICIEANSEYTLELVANRKCDIVQNVVTSKDSQEMSFLLNEGQGGLIGDTFDNKQSKSEKNVAKLISVSLTTVLDSLQAPTSIGYLSLDVEGAETEVLRKFNYEKYKFFIVTVERPKQDLHDLLSIHGYWWVKVMDVYGECLYIHETLPNFETVMNNHRSGKPHHRWAPRAQPHEYLLKPVWPKIAQQ